MYFKELLTNKKEQSTPGCDKDVVRNVTSIFDNGCDAHNIQMM